MVKVLFNGRRMDIDENDDDVITYEELCHLANKLVRQYPTVTYSTPDGWSGTAVAGETITLVNDMVINVVVAG